MIRGGKRFVSSPPAFSNDAKKLLVCAGNTVSIFSTSTGLQIAELEGHKARVTSVIVVPASVPASKILCYCWTASLDGTIRYWDFSVPELMKTVDIRFPIFSMVIPSLFSQPAENNEKTPDLFAYVSTGDANQPAVDNEKTPDLLAHVPTGDANQPDKKQGALHGHIRKCNLTKSHLAGGVTLAETKEPESITVCSSGKFFGIKDKRKLRIWNVPAKDAERIEVKKIRLHHTKNLTTLAFHPTERIVAAGDVTGRILIWRDFGNRTFCCNDKTINGRLMNNEDERPGVRGDDDADSCSTWHWHSAGVKLLHFSSDGAYLYSGGNEGVLVVWQLDTGKKKFLPRIGSPILSFINSPDPLLSSISCANNQIHIVKMSSMEILKSIDGIKPPCPVPKVYEGSCSGFVFDSTAGLVAVCAENYCIQFYSLFDDREISEVRICERNHQPGDELRLVITLLALSLDGCIMSTVETRLSEEGMGGLVSLKFWTCGSQKKNFSLSTIVYEPHRESGISSIAFHPTRHMAVSTSHGGDFKIWVGSNEMQRKAQMLQKAGWTCHAVGSYKKKPMTAAAFSADGSVLAVAAETFITLWDPEKNVLVAVIGDGLEPIVSLSFVGQSEYLVSASRGSNAAVSVWSMSKLSVTWSYKLQAEAVACTDDGSSFAVLVHFPESSKLRKSLGSEDGAILLFKDQDPVPAGTWFVKKALGGGIAFIHQTNPVALEEKSDGDPSPLLLAYVNGDHEYILCDPYGEQAYEQGIVRGKSLAAFQETGQFGYASIYGELPEFDLNRDQTPAIPFVPSERPWETIFSGSSHSLPPLTKLCSSFLESLLEKRTAVME